MKEIYKRFKKFYKKKGIYHIFSLVIPNIMNSFKFSYDKCHYFYWFFYSRLFNKPLIHVIGDSHVRTFRRFRLFVLHHLGSPTAYNLKNDKSTTNSKKKLFVIINKFNRKKDIALLVFGEVDCRVHIYYQYKKNDEKIKITELINRTISNYGWVLEQLKKMDVNFFVFCIPPTRQKQRAYCPKKLNAPAETRRKIFEVFNKKLKKFCIKNNYKYIDIYSKITDKNGFMSENYAADDVHLNGKIDKFLYEVLDKKFKISL